LNDRAGSKNIYLVPGLGADVRLFAKLQWPPGFSIHAIKWIEPFDAEPISGYASRLCDQIDKNQPFIIAGVSQGGIMAIEMAKIVSPEKIIIISSIKNKREKPFYFNLGHFFKNIQMVSPKHKIWLRIIVRIFFGHMSRKQFDLFTDMLIKTGEKQIKWSQNAIMNWDNTQKFDNLFHIHGTCDLVFPVIFIRNYIPVKGGNHFMVVTKANQISEILKSLLKT
jgi:hypothetical protein